MAPDLVLAAKNLTNERLTTLDPQGSLTPSLLLYGRHGDNGIELSGVVDPENFHTALPTLSAYLVGGGATEAVFVAPQEWLNSADAEQDLLPRNRPSEPTDAVVMLRLTKNTVMGRSAAMMRRRGQPPFIGPWEPCADYDPSASSVSAFIQAGLLLAESAKKPESGALRLKLDQLWRRKDVDAMVEAVSVDAIRSAYMSVASPPTG